MDARHQAPFRDLEASVGLISRDALAEQTGLSSSRLERLYRERSRNGHPEAVGSHAGHLVFDEQEWFAWFGQWKVDQAIEQGRDVATRAQLSERAGVSNTLLAKLYAERRRNGHPEALGTLGHKTLVWDVEEFGAWFRGWRSKRDVEEGREVCTREELAARAGLSYTRLAQMYGDRGANGHPEPVGKLGRRLVWDWEEWKTWAESQQKSKSA